MTYRGSMIMLYRSEVQNRRWGYSNVYSAPSRNWGFNRMFSSGGFRPPLDMGPRLYLKGGYRVLAKSEYEAEIAAVKTAYAAPQSTTH